MTLPSVHLTGSPEQQGQAHGEALRERVRHNVAVYFDRFAREAGLPRDETLRRAGLYLQAVERGAPDYAAGMRGIAAGAGVSLAEIAALNVRYEILYYQYTQKAVEAVADGCTSFAVLPEASANGHLLLGQNWDWIPEVLGAVLHTRGPDGLETLAFTEAGIFGGKIGLNSAGLGLCVNGLLSADDDWSALRRPFHVRCREILASRDLEAAVRVITGEDRSCSTNFLIAQAPDRVADVEAAPRSFRLLGPLGGRLTHANHFEDPEAMGVEQPVTDRSYLSCNRARRMDALLGDAAPVSVPRLQELLRSHEEHPNSICRHPDPALPETQRSITVTSAIMDLAERRLWLTDRQPCENPFQEFRL